MKIAPLAAAVILGLAHPVALLGQAARLDTAVRLNLRGTVDLALLSGTITVRGWEMPDVKVVASTDDGILRFDATPNRITVRVERGREGGASHRNASYDVSVPRGTRLLLQSGSGSITASGSQGEVSATTVSGTINVSGARRLIELESVSGPIRASQLAGDLRAQNVSGSVRTEDASGRVEAWTVNGAIWLFGGRSTDVRAETVGGNITYAGPAATGGTYSFETHSGAIRVTLPRGSGARFKLETVSGTIRSDFPIQATAARPGGKGRVEFTIGDGQAQLRARTFSGRIGIKSDANPSIRRDSASIVRSDSTSRTRRDSASPTRRDSVSTTRRDSVSTRL